ncbi:MAG: MBL fold metallo-hydrolase [Dehalococcoidia bacterium]|nr:MAG: MBL fold metallo-hydrolase [Dehalococcoidia bacterium]UCG84688.1 MAG: MBL fold metallo-hydrolase [Dehalococcoidia bacterium]
MILKELVVGPFASNCFIVGSEATKEGMIIDPGANAESIVNTARGLGLSIVLIVATHSHIDHVGALGKVKELTGADYAVHEADVEGMSPSMFGRVFGVVMGGSMKSPPQPDRLLHDSDIIHVGDLSFTVLHTPGHTAGGISLLGDGVIFSGDTLFNFGIGRTDLSGGDYVTLINSIMTKIMELPDDTIVYPGHGPSTTVGAERHRNPFLI